MGIERKVGIGLAVALIGFFWLAGGFEGSSGHSPAPIPREVTASPSAPPPVPGSDAPTVMDLIPAHPGFLSVLTHSKDGLGLATIGGYKWDVPGKVKLATAFATDVATIRCEKEVLSKPPGEDESCDGRGEKKVKVGSYAGCLSKEDRPGVGALGLSVAWPGCSLFFKVGAIEGHTPADAIRAANDASDWIDHFRPGHSLPSQGELQANRDRLVVARQLARERGMR